MSKPAVPVSSAAPVASEAAIDGCAAADGSDLRLGWTEFYWGIIEQGSGASRRAAREAEWLDALQAELPIPVDELEVAWTHIDDGRVLACAMPVASLRELLDAEMRRTHSGSARMCGLLTLGPADLPPILRDAAPDIDVSSINFLTGSYTPACIQSLRARARRLGMFYVTAAISLIGVGVRWRALEAAREHESIDVQTREVLAEAGFENRDKAIGTRELLETTSVVRRARGPEAASAALGDASISLTTLLRNWPAGVDAQTSHLSITDRAASLSIQLADESQAQAVGTALARCEGWMLLPPRTQRSGGGSGVQLFATLKKSSGAEGNR
ncbi:MAG: hypothetical protein ACREJD_17745 [Phycisphaerales bacterium]